MGKRRMSGNEVDRLERLKAENKHLRKQIGRLQKQLNRMDIDKFQNLEEIVDVQCKEEEQFHHKSTRDALREKWKCFKCQEGYLKLIIYPRLDGVWYQRRCTECGKKTKLQRYHEGVEGVKE
jgi:hypothetical protein